MNAQVPPQGDQIDGSGQTALWHAAHHGYLAVVRCLVEERWASVDQPCNNGITALS